MSLQGFVKTSFRLLTTGLAILVEVVCPVMCERIERNYPVAGDEISEKLETFEKVLHDLLGTSAKNLRNDHGLAVNEDGNWKLVDYVNHARKA